jgi:hypothetical protein
MEMAHKGLDRVRLRENGDYAAKSGLVFVLPLEARSIMSIFYQIIFVRKPDQSKNVLEPNHSYVVYQRDPLSI